MFCILCSFYLFFSAFSAFFYEARPVNHKIRLIASSFYPSFHIWPNRLLYYSVVSFNLCDDAHPLRRALCPLRGPGCRPNNHNEFQTSQATFFPMFSGGRKNLSSPRHAAISNALLFSLRHSVPSRSIAQQRMSSFLATAVIAIFLRELLPRKIR